MPKAHVFVDETKQSAYVLTAAFVSPADIVPLRRALLALLPRRQRRLHMVNEHDSLRRKLLGVLADAAATVDLVVAGSLYATDIERRRACLARLVEDIAEDCIALTLESDVTQDRRDLRDLIDITRRAGCRDLRYGHRSPYEEPLLWVPDAVGWAYARGGEWRRLAQPMIRRVSQV